MTLKEIIGAVVGLLLALAGQVTLSSWAPWLSERLDLFLIVVVWFGVTGSVMMAMLTGAAAGLLQDVWFGGLPGRNGFRKVLTGYLVAFVGSRFSLEGSPAHFVALASATLLDHLAGSGLNRMMGLPLSPPLSMMILQKALITAVVGTLAYSTIGKFVAARERGRPIRLESRSGRGDQTVRWAGRS